MFAAKFKFEQKCFEMACITDILEELWLYFLQFDSWAIAPLGSGVSHFTPELQLVHKQEICFWNNLHYQHQGKEY